MTDSSPNDCWLPPDFRHPTRLEDVLEIAIPVWIASEWPPTRPRSIGRDLTWAEWRGRAGA